MQERIVGIGHNRPPVGDLAAASWLLGREARITRRERPVGTAGRGRAGDWVLRFERRTQPFVEPLMGWTGGDDTLASEVELVFASCEEAVAYAERQGLAYRVEAVPGAEPSRSRIRIGPMRRVAAHAPIGPRLMPPVAAEGRAAGSAELGRALVNPAAVFGTPDEVVRHPVLTRAEKRDLLRRWLWDEILKDMAVGEGMPEGSEPCCLEDVNAALLRLEEDWHPRPAAPAARAVRYEQDPRLALAA